MPHAYVPEALQSRAFEPSNAGEQRRDRRFKPGDRRLRPGDRRFERSYARLVVGSRDGGRGDDGGLRGRRVILHGAA